MKNTESRWRQHILCVSTIWVSWRVMGCNLFFGPYPHRCESPHWDSSLLDTHTGNCQRCWHSFHPGRDLAAPGTHRYLENNSAGCEWYSDNMLQCMVDWWNTCSSFVVLVLGVLPSRMTVMGLGLKPSPPGQRVLYSATDKKGRLQQDSMTFHSIMAKRAWK